MVPANSSRRQRHQRALLRCCAAEREDGSTVGSHSALRWPRSYDHFYARSVPCLSVSYALPTPQYSQVRTTYSNVLGTVQYARGNCDMSIACAAVTDTASPPACVTRRGVGPLYEERYCTPCNSPSRSPTSRGSGGTLFFAESRTCMHTTELQYGAHTEHPWT